MIKKLDDVLLSNHDIIFFNEDSNYVTFFSNEIGILSVNLNKINLDDVIFDEDDPETIINLRHLLGIIDLHKVKHLKLN